MCCTNRDKSHGPVNPFFKLQFHPATRSAFCFPFSLISFPMQSYSPQQTIFITCSLKCILFPSYSTCSSTFLPLNFGILYSCAMLSQRLPFCNPHSQSCQNLHSTPIPSPLYIHTHPIAVRHKIIPMKAPQSSKRLIANQEKESIETLAIMAACYPSRDASGSGRIARTTELKSRITRGKGCHFKHP